MMARSLATWAGVRVFVYVLVLLVLHLLPGWSAGQLGPGGEVGVSAIVIPTVLLATALGSRSRNHHIILPNHGVSWLGALIPPATLIVIAETLLNVFTDL